MSRTAYFIAVIAASVVAIGASWIQLPPTDWGVVLMLALIAVVADSMAFELPLHGSVSLAFSATYAALLYDGPTAAACAALLGSVSVAEFRSKKPPLHIAYNSAQLVLSTLAAGWVYVALGGQPLTAGWRAASVGVVLAAALAAASTFFVANILLVGTGMSFAHRVPLRDVLRGQGFAGYWASLVVLALLGFVMAHLIHTGSWLGLLLLVLPFALARRTFRVYLELSEAYTATVRSLVTAIEAKDPYTRGHSERVALLSRALAERTGLPDDEVEIVERAALLHDVGKIGVSVATLTSAAPLTADEVREIRNHPVIGSELLEKVDFLSSIVPIVRHHHEHMDGAGYPDGLSGNEIPLYARLLAAVDAFDAMTSDRAYRPAMSDTEAMAEMVRVAGQQLDPSMVNALSALLLERQRSEVQQA